MKIKSISVIVFMTLVLMGVQSQAVITSSFGELPEATFGGSGIPNDSVSMTEYSGSDYAFTLGLTAHQRYTNPALANDGAGTFVAKAGGDVLNGKPGYGMWNFGFYTELNILNNSLPNDFSVRLYYDTDPASGNEMTTYLSAPLVSSGNSALYQNSWNLGMQSLFGNGFDPSLVGEYELRLTLHQGENPVGETAILVIVEKNDNSTPVPDGGTSVLMAGAAFACLASVRKFARN